MGKIENTWPETWKTKVSVLDKAKKIWQQASEFAYNVFGSDSYPGFGDTYRKNWKLWIYGLVPHKYDDFMICCEGEFIWARVRKVFRLINNKWEEVKVLKDGKEETFEVDSIRETEEFLSMKWRIPAWNIYRCGDGWGVVARNWVIVPAKFSEVFPSSLIKDGLYESIAIWIETLENWDTERRQISMDDGSITEYIEPQEEYPDSIDELKSKCRDYAYNRFLSDKVKIYEWWKSSRISTYMEKWKIWIRWILEPQFDELYAPFKGYSIGIARLWDKYWLISMRDGLIIREIKYEKIIEDNRTKSLVLVLWDEIEEIFCDSYKESKHSEKADN